MCHGRLRAQRALLIAQANLFFFDGRGEDLEDFLETGWLPAGASRVLPYDPSVLSSAQSTLENRRGGKG